MREIAELKAQIAREQQLREKAEAKSQSESEARALAERRAKDACVAAERRAAELKSERDRSRALASSKSSTPRRTLTYQRCARSAGEPERSVQPPRGRVQSCGRCDEPSLPPEGKQAAARGQIERGGRQPVDAVSQGVRHATASRVRQHSLLSQV